MHRRRRTLTRTGGQFIATVVTAALVWCAFVSALIKGELWIASLLLAAAVVNVTANHGTRREDAKAADEKPDDNLDEMLR